MSSAEENKAIVRRLFKALAEGDLDAIRELLAPEFVDHRPYPGEEDPGPEGYLRAAAGAHAAFTNLRYVFVEQMPDEGDRVVSRLTMRATHDRAEIAGFAPTSKEYASTLIAIHRIEEGKIVEGDSAKFTCRIVRSRGPIGQRGVCDPTSPARGGHYILWCWIDMRDPAWRSC